MELCDKKAETFTIFWNQTKSETSFDLRRLTFVGNAMLYLFIDDFSYMVTTYVIAKMSEVFSFHEQKIDRLRSHNDTFQLNLKNEINFFRTLIEKTTVIKAAYHISTIFLEKNSVQQVQKLLDTQQMDIAIKHIVTSRHSEFQLIFGGKIKIMERLHMSKDCGYPHCLTKSYGFQYHHNVCNTFVKNC